MTAVEWLEADFERRLGKLREAFGADAPWPFRPLFELMAQDDIEATSSWPMPYPEDDLDRREPEPLSWFTAERWPA